jgi:poly-beta-1,6-N-acetyl-D-glucosamine synthase
MSTRSGVTILIPAYNEAESLGETLRSVREQTFPPAEVIVIDDCSTDGTAAIAREAGVRVVRTPANLGSKASAQNYALPLVATEYTLSIDADTSLAPDALERAMEAFDDPGVDAACGFVLPRHVRTIWERGRYIEYLFAFTFYKQVQDFYGAPMIASGCFSVYRTEALVTLGGWPGETVAEDMDLTWRLLKAGRGVRFVTESISYPIEPSSYAFLQRQLRRWSHGYVQNVGAHWRDVLDVPFLRSTVAVTMWDALFASLAFLVLIPLAALVFGEPWLLLAYVLDLPALLIPIMAAAIPRGEAGRALASLPAFFVIRVVNALFFLRAIWYEWVVRKPLLVFEKGH